MANFLIVVDPDAPRRAAFAGMAGPQLALVDGLVSGGREAGDFTALWACGPRAPVTSWSDGTGAAVIWGRALAEDGRLVEAGDLPAIWRDVPAAMPPAFDGYHVAVGYDPRRGVTLGADLLGMYPVYWWSDGRVLLAGSSPELFRHHPSFRWSLDLDGLVGILLTSHSVAGRTLMQGVRRLGSGHLLAWPPGSAPREVRQYTLPASTAHFDLPFTKATELVYETLKRAVDRHVPAGTPVALSLSGGRDSRLIAGLARELGRAPVAVTFGAADDFEMQCAKGVAHALEMPHHTHPVPFDPTDIQAKLHAKWLHCTTGFSSLNYWHSHRYVGDLAPFLAVGYAMDAVIGGSHMEWIYADGVAAPSFMNFFSKINAYGVPVGLLRRLLRRDRFGDRIDEVVQQLQAIYEAYSPFEAQRAWCFDLHHRQRFQIANPPWSFSFGAWPIMPGVDRQVLEAAGGLPAGVLADRRAQDEVIRRWFPTLAELPLDRNGPDTTPLSPRIRHRIQAGLRARIAPLAQRLRRLKGDEGERRYYYRVYDFNSPAWKASRRQAEPHREKLHALFDRTVLDELLPPADTDAKLPQGIVDASGKKLLVGLCLWAGEYL